MTDTSWVTLFPDTVSAGTLPDTSGLVILPDTTFPLGISSFADTFDPGLPRFLIPDSILSRLIGSLDTLPLNLHLPNFFRISDNSGMAGIAKAVDPPMDVQPFFTAGPDLYFYVILLGLIIVAHTRFLYGRRLKQLAMGVFRERNMYTLMREGHLPGERISIGLFILYLTQVSLMFFFLNTRILHFAFPHWDKFLGYLYIIAAVVGLWLLKWIIIKMISWIFKTEEITGLYQVNLLAFNFMAGIVLLVLSVPAIYLENTWIIPVYAGAYILLMLYRLFRNAGIGISEKQYSFFYLMIYLSSVELMLPAVLVKIALMLSSFPQM